MVYLYYEYATPNLIYVMEIDVDIQLDSVFVSVLAHTGPEAMADFRADSIAVGQLVSGVYQFNVSIEDDFNFFYDEFEFEQPVLNQFCKLCPDPDNWLDILDVVI